MLGEKQEIVLQDVIFSPEKGNESFDESCDVKSDLLAMESHY